MDSNKYNSDILAKRFSAVEILGYNCENSNRQLIDHSNLEKSLGCDLSLFYEVLNALSSLFFIQATR